MATSVKIAVTGAAGAIGYAILPRIAAGEMFGPDTKITLHLLELPFAMKALEGVVMELNDCAFPLLENIIVSDQSEEAFDGINWAILIGSKPRTKGMERNDLIRDNGPIFVGQGKAIEAKAASDVRVVVVGNPCNTNALIAMENAKGVPRDRFSAMTRLDQNRTMAQLATKAGVGVANVTNVAIWGNHSATQYPDAANAKINGQPVMEVIQDHAWLQGEMIKTIQQRGAAIIAARGSSSAMSAANAAIDHVKSLVTPTPAGDWFSAAIPSDGQYGITPGLLFSYPCRSNGDGNWEIVDGLPISEFAAEKIKNTEQELLDEKTVVADLLV